jgi:hypothetical protein
MRTKKPGVAARARAKRPGAMRARKAGGNVAQRGGAVKSAHAKARGNKVAATRTPKAAAHKESATPAVKKTPVASTGNGAATLLREPAGNGLHASPPPRGNPPPLPSPIASFNF